MLLRFTAALCLAFFSTGTHEALAGTCRKDAREVRLGQDSVIRLSEYQCRSDRDPQAQVRVQFQRLSGLAAGALLNSGAAPWHDVLYGKYRIVSNDVLKEYRALLGRFGTAVRAKDGGGGEEIAINIRVNLPDQPAADDSQYANAGKGSEVRSFRLPDLPDIPLVDETVEILTKTTWPASIGMYYSSESVSGDDASIKSPLDEMTVWRYLGPADVKEYSQRLARYNKLVADREYGTRKPEPRAVQFLQYLTAGGWPETFLYSATSLVRGEPCVFLDFRTHQYAVTVEIAVIENTSTRPIQISQLLGRSGGGSQLRQFTRTPAAFDANALQAETGTLAPRERLIVPLAIVLDVDPYKSDNSPQKREELSQARFRRIGASRAGTVFRTEVYSTLRGSAPAKDDMFAVRKARESFKAPSFPTESDFAFGPEWSLNGLDLGGERILFDALAPNFLEITAGNEVGSCPILYAWNRPDATWLRHGKIIHKAQSRENRASETVTFDGFVSRFRIAEEELERAVIAEVKLTVELKDGRSETLMPAGDGLPTNGAFELYANEEKEIAFALPDHLSEPDVLRSRLTVTGYYDRYPALLFSRQ